jgi:hypothetical protein|nr:MAG TPA: chaperonin [Caudoviricetes sp.]
MIDYGVTIPNYIECLPNSLFVKNIEYGERTLKSGFILPPEQMDYEGRFARPRWAKVVYKASNINYVNVGDWILLRHGHWSTSMAMTIKGEDKTLWYVSPKSIKEGLMAVSKIMPQQLKEFGIEDDSL